MKNKRECICKIEGSFERHKIGVAVYGDKTSRISFVVDSSQMAESAKLLLLIGAEKTFQVKFYEGDESDQTPQRETRRTPRKIL